MRIRDPQSPQTTSGHPAPRVALRVLGLALLLALRGDAQVGPHGVGPQPIGQPVGGVLEELGNHDPAEQERQLRVLNAERQKSMVSDANKLLKLVRELDAEIGRENPAALSSSQMHKLGEIEKLARNVKEKMSTSVRGTPAYQQQGPFH